MKETLAAGIFATLLGLVGFGIGFFLILWGGTSGPGWFEKYGVRNLILTTAAGGVGGWIFGIWIA